MAKYEVKRLKSGLTLIEVKLPIESVTVLTMVRAGSRDEDENQIGGAHFLEHFVFKGTKKFPSVSGINNAIDEIGGKLNAFTWNDYTGFWVKVASDFLQTGVDVVSQLVCEPLLPEEELEKEKGTVIEEIKMYEDSHPRKAMEEVEKLVFGKMVLGRPILGTEETIKNMKKDDLKSFRDRWYYPENMVVIIAGGWDKSIKMEGLIEEKFATIADKKQGKIKRDVDHVFTDDSPRVNVIKRKTEQAHVVLGLRSLAADDEKLATQLVLTNIMGGNMSSRLWDEVREKRGLAYYVRAGEEAHADVGLWVVRAGVRLDKVKEAVDLIKKELLKAAEGDIDEAELKRGKMSVIGNLKLDAEDSQELALMAGDNWVLLDGKVKTLDEIVEEIEEVSLEEVNSLAKELFVEEKMKLAVVGAVEENFADF